MKHLATIQTEFSKIALKLRDDLSIDEQWSYLRDHPKSKKKLTAKPRSQKNPEKVVDPREIYEMVLRND